MKTIFVTFLLVLGVSVTRASVENADWGRSECTSRGGQVLTLALDFAQARQIEVCQFNQSIIELDTFDRSRFNPFGGPQANRAYRETRNFDFNACQRFYGSVVRGLEIKTSRLVNVCEFPDHSWIGADTLSDGVSSPWNRELNNALGIF